jgi:hypothetical protein
MMRLFVSNKRPALAVVDSAPVPAERADRAPLKAALAARDQAIQAVIEARETLGRLESVVQVSNDASRAAADDAHAANESREQWVRGGCKPSEGLALQVLTKKADESARVAEREAVTAKAASREVARARDLVAYAQGEVRFREKDVAAEIGLIIAREQEMPLLQRYIAHMSEGRALRVQVMALSRVIAPGEYENQIARSPEGARLVDAALERAAIKSWDKEREDAQAHDFVHGPRGRDEAMLEELASRWRARAAQLRQDPES